MIRLHGICVILVLFGYVGLVFAEPVQWSEENGGNGHFYEFVDAVTWREAFDLSSTMWFEGCWGHLVTLASPEEEHWIEQTFPVREYLFIGFYQPPGSIEPDGGWRWVTEEPITYVNWQGEEPNDGIPGEDYAGINPLGFGLGGWVDIWDSYSSAAIVEYDIGDPVATEEVQWGQLKLLYR